MTRRSILEMKFVRPTGPIDTVEIDVDSLPASSYGYGQSVENALAPLAAALDGQVGTVYVYEGPSVNFRSSTWSAFFGVAGPKAILEALYATFRATPGVKVRHSDAISSNQALCQYHLQDGRLWQADDAAEWYSADPEDTAVAEECIVEPDAGEESAAKEDEDDEWASPPATLPVTRPAIPNRYRAARADASVGSIRQTIETVFGLPAGSVALRGPDRSVLRADATIRTLRKRWES
jgi:hypothetical protein